MAKKRERLEVIYDILKAIRDSGNIKPTRLLYASNLSPQMFKDYIKELLEKQFILQQEKKGKKEYILSTKGFEFLEKYKTILEFIDNFGL